MAPPFDALDDYLEETLDLPIRGKIYKIPPPDGETGLWLQRVQNIGVKVERKKLTESQAAELLLDDDQELDLYERVLGPVLDEMIADGLSWSLIGQVAQTAVRWTVGSRDVAETYWREEVVGARPKARRQPQDHKPAARKTAAKKTATKKTVAKRTSSRSGSTTRTR